MGLFDKKKKESPIVDDKPIAQENPPPPTPEIKEGLFKAPPVSSQVVAEVPKPEIKPQPVEQPKEAFAPERLPSMPMSNLPMETFAHKDLPRYTEEIPEFSHVSLEELPVLELEQPYEHEVELRNPIYIRTDYFREVLTNVDTIKNYVNESSEIIYGLKNLKRNADVEHKNYKKTLEDIQRKLIYMNKVIFK